MKIKSVRIIALLLAVLILMTSLTGCSEAGRDLLMGFVQEWINTKFGIDTTDPDWSSKLIAGAQLLKLFNEDSTGNPDADAALGTAKMVKNFAQAENYMDLGRRTDNATAMDEAIKLRPDDWSYSMSRGVLAMKQGDTNASDFYRMRVDQQLKADKNPSSNLRSLTQQINEEGNLEKSAQFASLSKQTKEMVTYDLYICYRDRYAITHDFNDNFNAINYNTKYKTLTGQSAK